jgi:hypothetical protein
VKIIPHYRNRHAGATLSGFLWQANAKAVAAYFLGHFWDQSG